LTPIKETRELRNFDHRASCNQNTDKEHFIDGRETKETARETRSKDLKMKNSTGEITKQKIFNLSSDPATRKQSNMAFTLMKPEFKASTITLQQGLSDLVKTEEMQDSRKDHALAIVD
jgi:hypothetical protein